METLRLLTWGEYAPEKVVKMFKAETGIDVEVTNSNNEEMISKLRATGGAGFDLAQPYSAPGLGLAVRSRVGRDALPNRPASSDQIVEEGQNAIFNEIISFDSLVGNE